MTHVPWHYCNFTGNILPLNCRMTFLFFPAFLPQFSSFPGLPGIICRAGWGGSLVQGALTMTTTVHSKFNILCIFSPLPASLPQPHLHHQLVVEHADLQDAVASGSLQAAGEAEGGFGGAPRPCALHLQPGPRHQEHPALTLLRQVWRSRPRPRAYFYIWI